MRPTLLKTGDQSLWRVSDNKDGKDYCIPLLATPCEMGGAQCYLIVPGYTLSSMAQVNFLRNRLDGSSDRSANNEWVMVAKKFEALAKKCANREMAQDVLKWPDDDAPESQEDTIDVQFLKYVASNTNFNNLDQLKLVYAAICYHGVRWMLEQNKPLNLGFATITALPYRENWQQIVHAAYPNSLRALEFKDPVERAAAMRVLHMQDVFHSEDLISCNPDGTFNWSLNISPNPSFTETARAGEVSCLVNAPSKLSYLARWYQLTRRLYDYSVETLASFIQKASLPLGSVVEGDAAGGSRLVPRRAAGRVRIAPTPPPDTRYQTGSHAPDDLKREDAKPAKKAAEDLQEVPDGDICIRIKPHQPRHLRQARGVG